METIQMENFAGSVQWNFQKPIEFLEEINMKILQWKKLQ